MTRLDEHPYKDYLRLAMELNQALDEHDGHESPAILPDGEPIFTRDQADAF